MNIVDIQISRAIAHEVVRATQLTERPPILSDELVALDTPSKKLVGKRLVDTVASGSHCVDVSVDDETIGSPFDKATKMLDSSDIDFVRLSQELASSLSAAQTAGSIKSGSAIFAQGSCFIDAEPRRFWAIIKADSDQALFKSVEGDSVVLTYASDMLLGESQRLLKIAFFIDEVGSNGSEPPPVPRSAADIGIKVFDHLMQTSGSSDAAAYFYSTFLKCTIATDASRLTRLFYETTKSFIDELNVDPQEKVDLRGDLIAYLRGNRTILEPRTFAKDVLPAAQQDLFIARCHSQAIDTAFSKDLTLLKGKLRRQSVKFSSNVTLFASPDVFKEAIRIMGESPDGWTDLRILGSVETMS
jgi:hypothetical protein